MNFGSRFIPRYIAAIRWFIPLEVREDAATLTRAQNVINAVVMAALSGPLYAFTYHALGYGAAARVILTCCAGMFVAPFLLRATRSIVVAREVFLCAVFFNFSWLTYAMGGVAAPTAGWMVVPPMVAMFLGGFATAMFWLGLTCVTLLFIHALPQLGIPLPANPVEDMALLYLLCDIGLYIVIVLFVLLFELTKTQGFVKLQHALDFLHELATRDALTGGQRRRHLLALVAREREHDTPCCLCLLEIEGFQHLNDSLGHASGELVLRAVALGIKEHLRAGDAFGRYGGAQFLLLLPRTTQGEAQRFAQQLRLGLGRLRVAGLAPAPALTVSIGLAGFRPGESVGQTMACADEALLQARAGQGVVAYGAAPEPAPPAAGAITLEADATTRDALTGLLTRRVLRDRLGHAMARTLRSGRVVGLMLLNVNKFRELNDAFGAAAGDAVLAQVAVQLRACLDVADTAVRWNADEFIVILEDLRSAGETQLVAEKILDRFAFPLALAERELAVTLSIGIATFPAPGCDMDVLLERARLAMTRARNQGGNFAQMAAPQADPAPGERQRLKNGLGAALAANELRLEYRPQVELASGLITGVDALMYWAHPEDGRLEAARFMPLAEETGLVLPIGEWALRSACLHNAAWHAAGLPALRTRVRLSARQLLHPGMLEAILAIVRQTGIAPHCLELEIGAHALADDTASYAAQLGQLRRAGLRIAIGGFGTAGSGLHCLATLPADSLKLDRAFVAQLGQPTRDARAWSLAQSLVQMAQRLELTVVAEAVETQAQLADLRAIGCDAAQGDVFPRAATSAEVAELLARPLITPLAASAAP